MFCGGGQPAHAPQVLDGPKVGASGQHVRAKTWRRCADNIRRQSRDWRSFLRSAPPECGSRAPSLSENSRPYSCACVQHRLCAHDTPPARSAAAPSSGTGVCFFPFPRIQSRRFASSIRPSGSHQLRISESAHRGTRRDPRIALSEPRALRHFGIQQPVDSSIVV